MTRPLNLIANQSCILGVKINGASFQIETLNFLDDQKKYDYICNVNPVLNHNGNGSFHISFTNNNLINGVPIGDWILYEGKIRYDWGESKVYFRMMDSKGHFTQEIFAASNTGSARDFSVDALARAIFPKAREVASEFTSANVYDIYTEFTSMPLDMSKVNRFLEESDDETIIEIFKEYTFDYFAKCFEMYNNLVKMLKNPSDRRDQMILQNVNMIYAKRIKSLK